MKQAATEGCYSLGSAEGFRNPPRGSTLQDVGADRTSTGLGKDEDEKVQCLTGKSPATGKRV